MNGETMASTYQDGLRECARLHTSIKLEAFEAGARVGQISCAEETHAELVEAGARLGVLATLLALGLAWWWAGRRG